MNNNNVIISSFKRINKGTLRDLIITVILAFAPLIFKVLFVFLGMKIDLMREVASGSIIFTSVSLLIPIWYTIKTAIEDKKKQQSQKDLLGPVLAIIILGEGVYIGCFFMQLINLNINTLAVILLSITAFSFSFYYAYKLRVNDEIDDPNENRSGNEAKLIKETTQMNENGLIKSKEKGRKGKLNIDENELDNDLGE